jgi:hypothetical protein
MNNDKKRIDKPGGKVKYTQQDKFAAIKILLNKGTIAGMAITGLAFIGLVVICGVQDYQYRKQIKTKAKNG